MIIILAASLKIYLPSTIYIFNNENPGNFIPFGKKVIRYYSQVGKAREHTHFTINGVAFPHHVYKPSAVPQLILNCC